MYVSFLSLASWRNYVHAEVSMTPGVTLFLGRNGQGKTNLVEAIGYLSTLSSHRVTQDAAMISKNADNAIIRARLENGARHVVAELQINRSRSNVAQLKGSPVKPRDVTQYCHCVIFAPEDLAIVRGDPSERRKFIDGLLTQLSPRFSAILADYDRVLKQRTNLLKTSRGVEAVSTLEIWNEKLIELGSEIIDARITLLKQLEAPTRLGYREIVGEEQSLSAHYQPSWGERAGPTQENFRAALEENYRNERERGLTLTGPHRDDILFELNELPVKGYASHGESWSFVLALKLAAAEILRHDSPVGDPIIILDDVFAELDNKRREQLVTAITRFEQVLITAAVPEDVPDRITGQKFNVVNGTIEQAEKTL